MKKMIFILTAACLLLTLSHPAAAEAPDYIIDEAELLTDIEEEALEALAAEISARYDFGVYLCIVPNYRTMYVGDMAETAEYIFLQEDMGTGPDGDGILLFLSIRDRDYWIATHGYGLTAFTDFGLIKLEDQFLDDFADDDWYGGACDYLSFCDQLLAQARAGTPLDAGSDGSTVFCAIVICLMFGFGLAAIVLFIMKGKMRSVFVKGEANHYVTGRKITHRSDRLIHISRTRRRIETNTSGHHGGHRGGSRGGGSFGGRGGKF